MKRELVRFNHLRNCLLCHAPSHSQTDLVRGLIPTPGVPIPVEYYHRSHGDFVRADVVYLKQDFSVMHHVEDAHPWPAMQRFDYVVRVREVALKSNKRRASTLIQTLTARQHLFRNVRQSCWRFVG